jgi:hypothetical protein
MRIRQSLAVAALAAGFVVPAFAQAQDGTGSTPDRDMGRMEGHGPNDHGVMPRGGKMGGHCAGMMQSMNGGDGRPNSQWQGPAPHDATPD